MKARLATRKAIQTYREHGLRGLFRSVAGVYGNAEPDDFDVARGTETTQDVPLWKMRIASPNVSHGTRYQAFGESELITAIALLPENPDDFCFIDLGCGKGRALMIASELGFKSVIGVEFASELVEVAKANLARMASSNVIVVEEDASQFQFPAGDLVVFLNNPFGQVIVDNVIANLPRSEAAKLYIIYKRPILAARFDAATFLERMESPPHLDIALWRKRAMLQSN